jgi:hypothetical protein
MTNSTVTRYSNYFERYNDAALDPFEGNYGDLMATFRTSIGREPNARANQLYEQVFVTSEVQPHIYLMLTQDVQQTPTIPVLHRPYCHVAPMGSPVTKLDVAFLGDMRGLLPPTVVYFPEDGFRHTGNILVPKPETLDQAFAEDSTLEAVGPYEPDEPGTDNVATRPIIYLPPKFAPIALANPTMTPRKAWESIAGLIRTGDDADVQVQAMQPLLDWIRAACTNCIDDHRLVSEAPSYPHPPVPSLDRAIEARLKRDLPGIVPDTGPQTSTTLAINHLTTEMLRVNQDGVLRDQSAKAKTPESYYGQGVVILCRVTYATTVQQLPQIYHDIAKSPKRMERQAVEERLRATADTLGLLDYVPAATAALTKKIAGCDFSHFDLQDLEAGIHPFGTTYRSPQSRTKLQQALSVYDDLREGAGASLLDFQVLRETEKVGVLYTMTEVTYCFKSFRVLLHTLLGPHHPLVQAWDQFVSMWIGGEARLSENLHMHQFVLVLRWLQIRFSTWFTDQHREPVHISVPDFTVLITKLLYEEAWEPTLPSRYQAIVPGLFGHPAPAPAPAPRTPATPARRAPGAPSNPAPAPAPAAAGGRGARVSNTTAHAAFTPFRQLNLPLGTVREKAKEANKPMPTNDMQTEFCLSYHVPGFCWENCGRKEDHRDHHPSERSALLNWCTECYREGGPM